MKLLALIIFFSITISSLRVPVMVQEGNAYFKAGAAKLNGTMPRGTPLAGYNHGARRVPFWPIPEFGEYTTFMTGSEGYIDITWVKALAIATPTESFMFVTMDGIGSDGTLNQMAYEIASAQGLSIPFENILFSSSHTHSGPGAVSPEFLWSIAPATDLVVPSLQRLMATNMAQVMLEAVSEMVPAKIGIGMDDLIGVTQNRRAGISPYVKKGTIDPHLGVIRVDTVDDKPIATVWNFAIHGVCYGPDNMYFSSDIMGGASTIIEENIGGIALFVNGDAGDIDPAEGMCNNKPAFVGSPIMADAVKKIHDTILTSETVEMKVYSQFVPFGPTNLNATLSRFANCDHGGPLDICTLCAILKCDLNAHLPSSWVENDPKFTALSFVIDGLSTIMVSIPGEALVELGWQIRNDTLDLGFNTTFLAGYSNSHMGYFATPNEYDIGGYESQLTLWGIQTSAMVRQGCKMVAKAVVP